VNKKNKNIIASESDTVSKVEILNNSGSSLPKLGDWCWIKTKNYCGEKQKYVTSDMFGCVQKIGSNYYSFRSVEFESGGYESVRIHIEKMLKLVRIEKKADEYISKKISYFQDKVNHYLDRIQTESKRLGLKKTNALNHKESSLNTEKSNQLSVISGESDLEEYENKLVEFKNNGLPHLQKKLKENIKNVSNWMSANTLGLQAQANLINSNIADIDDKIFNVKLYGGLGEYIITFNDGKLAPLSEKIHIMQRRLYMDEECLVSYKSGGMEFTDIPKFTEWLLKEENLNRIFPFQKCIVAFKVRRNEKLRTWINIGDIFSNRTKKLNDARTFLFVRNGESLFCVDADLEFDDIIFPDLNEFNPTQPVYCKMWSSRTVERSVSESCYLDMLNKNQVNDYEWELFNDDSVYYDEMNEYFINRMKKYNRIAYVLQGLLDRTEVLHPHVDIQAWKPASFEKHIKLVYDSDRALNSGDKPDFKAYWKKCNRSINIDSVVCGQKNYWTEKETKKENERRERRFGWDCREITNFRPVGNFGPFEVSKISKLYKSSNCVGFTWKKHRIIQSFCKSKYINSSLKVPIEKIFNISAYKLGDYKRFFNDPRTRQEYLQWAYFLLSAEDYHNGLIELKEPDSDPEDDEDLYWRY